ncbi:hypothetical protein DFJ77DRAFT_467360 [Powellomyces hirtus]|nr:hypothetical protein DFJ77DRAFT_467360 [Powellomyces hirtus]
MPGSVTSSRSSASRASSTMGSSIQGNGVLARIKKKYKNPFFSLLVTLVKDSEHNWIAMVSLIAEWLQLLNFAFEKHNWGTGTGEKWIFIMSMFQFENIIIDHISYSGLLAVISVVLALTCLLVWLSYYVFSGFFKGSFKAGIGPVRMLRAMVSALLTVGFIPLYVPLLAVYNCQHTHEERDDYPTCLEPINIAYGVLALMGIVVLIPFTFLATMTYFKPNSKCGSWSAKPSPRLELVELGAKIILASVQVFLVNVPMLRTVFLAVCSVLISAMIFVYVPFYNMRMNYLKFILSVELMWAAFCTFGADHLDSDSGGRTMLIVFWAGTPPMCVLAYFLFRLRWQTMVAVFSAPPAPAPLAGGDEEHQAVEHEGAAHKGLDMDRVGFFGFRGAWTVSLCTRSLNENSTEEDIRRAEMVFRRGMEMYPDDAELMVQAALFFTAYKDDNAMAVMLCQKVLKSNPPIDIEFTVFYLRRGGIFETSGGQRLDLVDQLDFKHLNKRAKNYHDEAKRKIGLFWKQLLIDQPVSSQVRMLNDLASQINKAERRAASAYERLCERFPIGRHWIAYANFIEEVQHNIKRADEIYAQYEAATTENESADDLDDRSSAGGGSSGRGTNASRRRGSVSHSAKITRIAGHGKKERRAYREYSRQIGSLKSAALQRMGAITKGIILVLIGVVLAEFVYCVLVTSNILNKVDTVISSGYRREAAIYVPQAFRDIQAAAVAKNATAFEAAKARVFSILGPLPALQKVLFFEQMRDEMQMEMWTVPSINITLLRSVTSLGHKYEYRLINLFDASTLLTTLGYLGVDGDMDYFSKGDELSGWEPWYFVLKNVPIQIADAFSRATYFFVDSVRTQIQFMFTVQEAFLAAISLAVFLSGVLLFTPTMRRVEAERERSLKAFTKIPRSVVESIYLKYTMGKGGVSNASSVLYDDDDMNNSDSEDEEDEEDEGEYIETSHAAVYRQMNRRIWLALGIIVVMFCSFFVGSYFTVLPLVDVTTRINLAMRIRFGALRASYLTKELVRNDTTIYPEYKSMMSTVLGDIVIQQQYSQSLILGVSSGLTRVDSQLDPSVRTLILQQDPASGLSINSAMLLLKDTATSLNAHPAPTATVPEFGYVQITSKMVSEGMLAVALALRSLYLDEARVVKLVTAAVFSGMVLVFGIIYIKVFRKVVRMLTDDKKSTLQLLLLIPPQTAIDMDIIKTLSSSGDGVIRLGWLANWLRGLQRRASTSVENAASAVEKPERSNMAKTASHTSGKLGVPVFTVPFTQQLSLTEIERGYGHPSSHSDGPPYPKPGTVTSTSQMSEQECELYDNNPALVDSPKEMDYSNEVIFSAEETLPSTTVATRHAPPRASVPGGPRKGVKRSSSTPLLGPERPDLRAIPEHHGSEHEHHAGGVSRSVLRSSITATSGMAPKRSEGVSWGAKEK